MKKYFPLFFIFLVVSSCTSMAQQQGLNPVRFEQGISLTGVQILDVRTQEEYNGGHIKNAFLADWNDQEKFNQRIAKLDKNKPVYTYCRSGRRSSAATSYLQKLGFKQVYNLDGGIEAWKAANKPVEL